MRKNRTAAPERLTRPTAAALLVALAFAACVAAGLVRPSASSASSAAPAPAGRVTPAGNMSDEEEEAAAAARGALSRMPPEARLGDIKDVRLRRAAQTAYRAVAELADNRDAARTAALNARFERAYAAFEREAARPAHKICALNCKECDGDPCRRDCKAAGRKFCGCKLLVFGCIVAECIF